MLRVACACLLTWACQNPAPTPPFGGTPLGSVRPLPQEEPRFSSTTRAQRQELVRKCSDDPCLRALFAAATDSGEREELTRIHAEHEQFLEELQETEARMLREVR